MEPLSPAPPKKRMGVVGWIVIGCLALVVAAGAVFVGGVWFVGKKAKHLAEGFEKDPVRAAAELAVRLNPEVDLVAVDEGTKTMTIREKATGKEVTLDWSRISEGQFRFGADGEEVTIEAVPPEDGGPGGTLTIQNGSSKTQARLGAGAPDSGLDWFPRYPGASEIAVNYTTQSGEGRNDYFTFTTQDTVDQVLSFYESAFDRDGFETNKSTFTTGDRAGGTILGWTADQGHTFTLVVEENNETTQVGVNSNRVP